MKRESLILGLVCLGVATAVIVNSNPLVRLIPADVLRDFPGRCYSWTSSKWFNPNETWSLSPFCGFSRCVLLRNTETNKTFLGEEVTDCGKIINTETSVGCTLLEDRYDKKAEFPNCCPVFDCAEDAVIEYVQKGKQPRKNE